MIEANKVLFRHLEDYCVRRDEALEAPGQTRWVQFDDDEERRLLRRLKIESCLRFGYHRSLSHLSVKDEHYIGLLGFDFDPNLPARVAAVAHNAGFATCLLSEIKPLPIVGPAQVRNIIEFSSKEDDPDYTGHRLVDLAGLFPPIQVFILPEPPGDGAIWRMFLMACVEECRQGGSWIEERLAGSLLALTDLDVPQFPYSSICRSVFDADPRSLYMALYRCVEATYAYESSRKLVENLGIVVPWQEMAAALEDTMGWRPQEASSLNLVLRYAIPRDLHTVCECLEVNIKDGDDVVAAAGRAIYSLRNSIVHFRPGIQRIDVESIDWNRLCECLAGIVLDVFSSAYSS